jgi:Gas vesicle synthesis protein GvpL/GvpF
MGHGFYLYGIFPVPGPQNLGLKGLDDQSVQTQEVDGFVFLYSEAQQERYLASSRNIKTHMGVLTKAMDEGHRTLLPLPLNRLIFQDWQTIAQQFTTPYKESLELLFSKLEGRREVSVKISWDTASEQQFMMAANPALTAERDRLEGKKLSMDEIIQFGQATERSMFAHQESILDNFREVLNPLAVEVVENAPQRENMIYNAAYLIPWEAEPKFNEEVEILDQQFNSRLKIQYNNFTPPFNFAQLDQLN